MSALAKCLVATLVAAVIAAAASFGPAGAASGAADGPAAAPKILSTAQNSLLAAWNGALSYYWAHNFSFGGISPQTLQQLVTPVEVVGAMTASTAGSVVSLAVTPDGGAIVLAGENGPNALCWSIIVDYSISDQLDGHEGYGTWYLALPRPGNAACDAAQFDQAGNVAGASTRTTPWGTTGAEQAEANLQTALTGAKTWYTENNQTYDGMTPQAFGQIDTGLTAVDGSTASAAARVVSLQVAEDGTAAILAIAPSRGAACRAIVDMTASDVLDGFTGYGTLYIDLPTPGPLGCRATLFNRTTQIPGSSISIDGWALTAEPQIVSTAQNSLLAARNAALNYYAAHSQSYAGLSVQTLQPWVMPVAVVGATTASTTGSVVSLAVTPDGGAIVLAGANGPDGLCWSIVVDNSASDQLDGHEGSGTWFVELPRPGASACDAARFDQAGTVTGSSSTSIRWGTTGAEEAEANLQTALTGAKTWYTQDNQSYDGLNPQTFEQLDTGLTAVDGSAASTAARVVSLHVAYGGTAVILAIAPSPGAACRAIVDMTSSYQLDGFTGYGTLYIELPTPSPAGCRADLFNRKTQLPGSSISVDGWSFDSAA